MKPSSAKQKGRVWQQEVCKSLLAVHKDLQPDDIRSTSMGCGGEDILLSPLARSILSATSWECKNLSSAALYNICAQADQNAIKYNPVIAMRLAPKSKAGTKKPPIKKLVVCELDFFIALLKRNVK